MLPISQDFFIYLSIAFVIIAISIYSIDKWSIFFKSIFILSFLLIFFSLFPYPDVNENNLLSPKVILSGFSNETLITVCALLVLGQGIVQTKALDGYISFILKIFSGNGIIVIFFSLFSVIILSAFLNNTPVVIIFIPVIQALAKKIGHSGSRYLMPLSYAAILGGMTTLIGSSTNLLVANSLYSITNIKIGFFDFFVPGIIIALSGIVYILFFAKFLLKRRSPMANELVTDSDKKFIAQVSLTKESPLVGKTSISGKFEGLENINIVLIQRKEHAEHGPLFNDFQLRVGDILVIATTKEELSEIISKKIGFCGSEISRIKTGEIDDQETNNQLLTEAVISPLSSLIGLNIESISFRYRFDCVVIGLQRRDRMIRKRMTQIPLEAGDVLLIQGSKKAIKDLRSGGDIMPMEWSSTEIIDPMLPKKAIFIFGTVILLSVFEILPLVVSSLLGVFTMLLTRVLSTRQAVSSVDYNLLLLIVTSLALGKVIFETGTANFLAQNLALLLKDSSIYIVLSCFFLFVALTTNLVSNNACAVLFTPIAIDLANNLGMDPKIFAISVIFAVNCSFMTPMAYQTNLLVMGPGHYKFSDFVIFGFPLTIICWITFSLFFPWYYNLV